VGQRLQTSRRPGSSFFFKRDTAVHTTPAALWRTVAFDLARKYPNVRRTIVAKLNEDEICPSTANIHVLFRHLIHEPLTASMDIPTGRLLVVEDLTDSIPTIEPVFCIQLKAGLAYHPSSSLSSPAEAKMTSSMPCHQLGTGLSIFRLAKWSVTDRQCSIIPPTAVRDSVPKIVAS
jgi:hypothetical protein